MSGRLRGEEDLRKGFLKLLRAHQTSITGVLGFSVSRGWTLTGRIATAHQAMPADSQSSGLGRIAIQSIGRDLKRKLKSGQVPVR